jgi:hypothetical protein
MTARLNGETYTKQADAIQPLPRHHRHKLHLRQESHLLGRETRRQRQSHCACRESRRALSSKNHCAWKCTQKIEELPRDPTPSLLCTYRWTSRLQVDALKSGDALKSRDASPLRGAEAARETAWQAQAGRQPDVGWWWGRDNCRSLHNACTE